MIFITRVLLLISVFAIPHYSFSQVSCNNNPSNSCSGTQPVLTSDNFFTFNVNACDVTFQTPNFNLGFWDFGDQTCDIGFLNITHTFPGNGTYLVSHCVNGNFRTVSIVINNCGPTFEPSYCNTGGMQDGNSPINTLTNTYVDNSNNPNNINYTRSWMATYIDYGPQLAPWFGGNPNPNPSPSFLGGAASITIPTSKCRRWGFWCITVELLNTLTLTLTDSNGNTYAATADDCPPTLTENTDDYIQQVTIEEVSKLVKERVSVYPNQLNSGAEVFVQIPIAFEEADFEARLFNLSGQYISTYQFGPGSQHFNTFGLVPGIYILVFESKEGIKFDKKIIIK